MPELLEGSQSVARAVAMCRPDVVCAYPISPQTHIVEALAGMVRTGKLKHCDYINVESEYAAMSVSIGASAAGGRVYTATASQGLLYMTEAIYNASGLGLPIVMTVANRALGGPINIWNDQSDSLSQRDSGWLQLFAADNQEALDLHILAYRVAEELSVPVMVCMDGFVLTHASDVVEMPTQEQVDKFLPPFTPRQALSIEHPGSIGMMAGPEIFTETKYLAHRTMLSARGVIEKASSEFEAQFGRVAGQLVRPYGDTRADDAEHRPAQSDEIVVVAMGSVLGTLQAVLPVLRAEGINIQLLGIGSYRPFPNQRLVQAVGEAKRVVVIDRAIQLGIGGVLSDDVQRALGSKPVTVDSVVAGLGGRPITEASLEDVLRRAAKGELEDLTFMDLNQEVVGEAA
ncbi:MAG: hypothetical protein LBM66_06085 [Bifidobacteriaceae bacterium]|jgi:pyruvate ferredoxin oxidoreductase alpha subunit|nr:hypothetical protein [Bifidobacteriaceae bacterium]